MYASLTTPRCYPLFPAQRPPGSSAKVVFGTDVGKTHDASKHSDDDVKTTSSKSHAPKTEQATSIKSASTDSLPKASDAKALHQAMLDTDQALAATSRWLKHFDQPTGKLPKPPAAPPSATFLKPDALQAALRRGDVTGFSPAFEQTLTQIQAAQGQNVNLYLQHRMQELKLHQRLELELLLRSSLDQGANRYALYTEARQQFKNTRTTPLNKIDIRRAFKYIGAPIHPVGLLAWRLRQFLKPSSKGVSLPVSQHPVS